MDAHNHLTLILEEEHIIAKVVEDTVNGFFLEVHHIVIYAMKEKGEKEKEETEKEEKKRQGKEEKEKEEKKKKEEEIRKLKKQQKKE